MDQDAMKYKRELIVCKATTVQIILTVVGVILEVTGLMQDNRTMSYVGLCLLAPVLLIEVVLRLKYKEEMEELVLGGNTEEIDK